MNQIHYRLNAEEAAIIEKKASEAGLKPNTYAKKIALEGKVKAPLLNQEAAKILLPQISKVGANINQIARSLNMGAEVPKEAVEDMKIQLSDLLDQIWAAILDGKKPKKKEEAAEAAPMDQEQTETENNDTQCSEEKHNETQENTDTQCNETEHTESQETPVCQNCGAPMERTLSAKGRYYWRCTEHGNKCPFGGWAD